MKIELQKLAREMRQEGKSISEIHRELKVSKSSVSIWVNGMNLSRSAKIKIHNNLSKGQIKSREVLRSKLLNKVKLLESEISDNFVNFKPDKFTKSVMCSLLYWCEGNKQKGEGVAFTNSDPNLVRTFINLLRDSFTLDESKFRVCMHLHSYHNEDKQKVFWSKITSIPTTQFTKSYIKPEGKIYKKEGYMGCVRIRYHDSDIARKIEIMSRYFYDKVILEKVLQSQ